MKIILLRHGESEWNSLNKFTGWTDIDLTPNGINEAIFSGSQISSLNIEINSVNTSILLRAVHTAKIVCQILNFDENKIVYNWELNERHYGALQGLNKSETASKYGENQVKIWRRSYDIPPPKLSESDNRHPKFNDKFNQIEKNLPSGESLKDVVERLSPFWIKFKSFLESNPGNHLIVAHSNSLRAIIKILENLDDNEIIKVEIPTGIPLMYTFDKNGEIINKEYLVDKKILREKTEMVINQGKAK